MCQLIFVNYLSLPTNPRYRGQTQGVVDKTMAAMAIKRLTACAQTPVDTNTQISRDY